MDGIFFVEQRPTAVGWRTTAVGRLRTAVLDLRSMPSALTAVFSLYNDWTAQVFLYDEKVLS